MPSSATAEGRIDLLSEQGETTVVKSRDEFDIIARNPLGERCQASLAVSQGRLDIRTDRHL